MKALRVMALLLSSLAVVSCGQGAGPAATSSLASSVSSAAAAKPASASAAPVKVVASYSNVIGNEIPLWLAKETGIFDRHGIDAELRLVESNKGIPALIADEVQFGEMAGPEVLSAAASGADVVTVAVHDPVYPYVFMAAADIKTVNDLKGKKVAVSSFGAGADTATRVALRKLGLDPDKDVSIVATGSLPNRTAAMLSGQIQSGVAQPPDSIVLAKNGFHVLFDLTGLNLPAAGMVVATRRSYVASHRSAVQGYVDALVEALAAAKRDRPGTISILKKYFKSEDDAAMAETYDFYVGRVFPDLPYPKAEQFADSKAILGEKNEKVRAFDLAAMVDDSFVRSAAERAGKR